MTKEIQIAAPMGRLYGFLLIFLLCSVALVARAVNLQVTETEFLQGQESAEQALADVEAAYVTAARAQGFVE